MVDTRRLQDALQRDADRQQQEAIRSQKERDAQEMKTRQLQAHISHFDMHVRRYIEDETRKANAVISSRNYSLMPAPVVSVGGPVRPVVLTLAGRAGMSLLLQFGMNSDGTVVITAQGCNFENRIIHMDQIAQHHIGEAVTVFIEAALTA
jgi:hypothetical protein